MESREKKGNDQMRDLVPPKHQTYVLRHGGQVGGEGRIKIKEEMWNISWKENVLPRIFFLLVKNSFQKM